MEREATRRLLFLLLLLLIATDAVFILIHLAYELGHIDRYIYSLSADRGYAEVFQYIKVFWIILLFTALAFIRRKQVFSLAAGLFAYILIDDAFQVHETVGKSLVTWFGLQPVFGIEEKNVGELLVSATAGTVFLILAAVVYTRAGRPARRTFHHLVLWCCVLAFFGVVVDMLHSSIHWKPWASSLMGIIEDGGEMLVMSWMVWYCFTRFNPPQAQSHPAAATAPEQTPPVEHPPAVVRGKPAL